jgi:hypothetical protein
MAVVSYAYPNLHVTSWQVFFIPIFIVAISMLYSIVRLLPFDHLDLPVFPVIKLHKCRPLYPHLIFHISHKNL